MISHQAQYSIRDPIHKSIGFNDFEKTIIDHPYVQRMRHIRQNDFGDMVYPGLTHGRFSHMVGSMHLAGRLFDAVMNNSPRVWDQFGEENCDYFRKLLRLAGLLHDVGHAPFSHALESQMPDFQELAIKQEWWYDPKEVRKAAHEDFSVLLIQDLGDQGVLGNSLAQDISSMVNEEVRPSQEFLDRFSDPQAAMAAHKVLKSLISGEIDCDRMDYLLRDSYFAGVAYGQYDVDWLLNNLGVAQKPTGIIFTVDENGVRAFEDFLLARYHMFLQMYFHKTKICFAYYLIQAIETGEIKVTIPTTADEYAELRDEKLIEMIYAAAKKKNNYWSAHLAKRIPAKMVVELQDRDPKDQQLFDDLSKHMAANNIRWFSRPLKKALSGVIGAADREDSPLYVVRRRFGVEEYIPIGDFSDLLKNYNQRIDLTYVYVLREDYEKFHATMHELVSCKL